MNIGAAPFTAEKDQALDDLRALLGERLLETDAARDAHGHDEAHHAPARPDAVALPESTAEVSEIVRLCAAARLPVIPWGVGTSLEGQVIPTRGGVTLDMGRMNRVLALHEADLDCVVQPGVTRKQLNEHLRDTGLFFSVDPGADATLGGMAATRASGTNAVRYGTMRENVLALEAVLADGTVVRTGTRARKSAAGYDLTHLLIGSEGTLGIITELTVRLHGQPEAAAAAVCAFPSVDDAVEGVILTMQMGLPVARIELLDEIQIDAVNRYSQMSLAVAPTLFLEFHGTEASVAETAERVREIAAEHGASAFDWATKPEERNRLWAARHSAYWAGKALRPGAAGWVTDACVPISRLAEAIAETKADLSASPLMAPMVGHVGDGNFHLSILLDPNDPAERAEAERISGRIAERALRLGGTVTGEHGVGLGKKGYLRAEHGDALDMMARIKRALDPLDILNPGKIVDHG